MIWTVLRRDLHANLLNFRFAGALLLTVVLSILTAYVNTVEYNLRYDSYRQELKQVQDGLAAATVYGQALPDVVLPPKPLSVFSRGVDHSVGSTVFLSLRQLPTSPAWSFGRRDSHLMKSLNQLDFATVVAVVIGFLAVTLGFDAICGEGEDGTLRQLLSNPLPRAHLVFARLLSGSLTLAVPIAVGFLLSVVVLVANAPVPLTGEDWLRLGLFLALTCLFVSQVYGLSLLVSACTYSRATSLTICLFCWLVGAVVYPSALPSVARHAILVTPLQEFRDVRQRITEEYERQVAAWEQQNPSPGPLYLEGLWQRGVLRFARPEGYDWMARRNAYEIEKQLDAAGQDYHALWDHQEEFAQQALLAERWSIASPFTNYRALTQQLAVTTMADKFRLTALARQYRQSCLDYLRGKGAFSSWRWFTDDQPGQTPMVQDPEGLDAASRQPDSPYMKVRREWAAQQQRMAVGDLGRRLDVTDMPKFAWRSERTLPESLATMVPGLVWALLLYGATWLGAILRFDRYRLT